MRKLQVGLGDFRRLCILKGIYPRAPKNKKQVSTTGSTVGTYYWVKDIQFLLHEPLLVTLRETKSFAKKVARYASKRAWAKVASLKEHLMPQYTLDHLIKERYPTFADALRDLDDALSMLYLFAALPNTTGESLGRTERRLALIPGQERVGFAHAAATLLREFEAVLIRERSIVRTFVSIKGIYYQAEVAGQTVTWIVPHERTTPLPADVDYRVMHTFLEFYQTLLGFVNFKLFSRAGWSYPLAPTVLRKSEADDASAQYRPLVLLEDLPRVGEGELPARCPCPQIFAQFTVFLAREVPRHSLSLLVQSAGGRVGWDCLDESSPLGEDAPGITHHVVDRPQLARMLPDRVYVQPQWVFDCVNAGRVLDVALYRIGATLPPHLSPFAEVLDVTGAGAEGSADAAGATVSAERKKLAVSMLSKKKKKLYDSLQSGLTAKAAEVARLKKRRAELEAAQE